MADLPHVARGKPAPDVFLRAAQLLGVEPGCCLVYEDSDEGLESARAAGMDAIDVRGVPRGDRPIASGRAVGPPA